MSRDKTWAVLAVGDTNLEWAERFLADRGIGVLSERPLPKGWGPGKFIEVAVSVQEWKFHFQASFSKEHRQFWAYE